MDTVEQTSMTFDPLVRHQATRERKPEFGALDAWLLIHPADVQSTTCTGQNTWPVSWLYPGCSSDNMINAYQ